MSLLTDLRLEVTKIRDAEQQQSAELLAQNEFYESELKHVMLRAYEYFGELVEKLNIVAPEIYPRYPLDPSMPEGIPLNQNSYEFGFDNGKSPRQINIICSCELEQPHEFYVPTESGVKRHTHLLEDYKFHFHRKGHRDKLHSVRSATFILEGPMKVHIRIIAHPADKCIYIDLRNLEEEPVKRYKFDPAMVTGELLDSLARLLVRKQSSLVTVKVCEEFRGELQQQIDRDRVQKAQELAEARAHAEAEKQAEENAKLVNRVKRAASETFRTVQARLARRQKSQK